jgi:competence protein ComEC
VSFVVVPLSLVSAVIPWAPLATLAHASMVPAVAVLDALAALPSAAWAQHAPPVWTVALAVAGAVWVLLPRGFPARWLGVLAMIPVVAAPVPRPAFGEAWVSVLDVGQGLATVVRTQAGTLVFDTGPAWSAEADSGSRIVVPFLRGEGVRMLDGVFVSHDDNDHAGGAASLLGAIPARWVVTSLPQGHPAVASATHVTACVAGQRWDWSGVHFEVLHPDALSYDRPGLKDNARSCVLRLSTGGASMLMTADIEKDVERALLDRGAELAATILVAPHHGSKTSSTQAFIEAVRPHVTVFSAGYRNRFGHPAAEVVARYQAAGSRIERTDEGGALRFVLDPDGYTFERWRDVRPRYWHAR